MTPVFAEEKSLMTVFLLRTVLVYVDMLPGLSIILTSHVVLFLI